MNRNAEEKIKKMVGEEFICPDCGKQTVRKSKNQKRCSECAHKKQLGQITAKNEEYRRRRKEGIPIEHKPSRVYHRRISKVQGAPVTQARCPMCRKMHDVVGLEKPTNGTVPWLYCERCRPLVYERAESMPLYSFGVI